jgi:lactoylglutathione lyase
MPVKSDVKLGVLGFVIVYVKDTEKTKKFYQETLGLQTKDDEPGWVTFDTGAASLALHSDSELKGERAKGQPVPVFNVDDFYKTYEGLKAAGVKFEAAPKEVCEAGPGQAGMSAEFKDPDGNLLSIFGIVKKK